MGWWQTKRNISPIGLTLRHHVRISLNKRAEWIELLRNE
jgi:hypothetical protein